MTSIQLPNITYSEVQEPQQNALVNGDEKLWNHVLNGRKLYSSCSAHVGYNTHVHARRRKKLGNLRKRLMVSSRGGDWRSGEWE
jgi:hypothetical protein